MYTGGDTLGKRNGAKAHGVTYSNAKGSESGILTNEKPEKIKEAKGGRDWVGMRTKERMTISMHMVRQAKKDSDRERLERMMG